MLQNAWEYFIMLLMFDNNTLKCLIMLHLQYYDL